MVLQGFLESYRESYIFHNSHISPHITHCKPWPCPSWQRSLIGLSVGGLISVGGLYAGGGGLYAEKYGMVASWRNLKEKIKLYSDRDS